MTKLFVGLLVSVLCAATAWFPTTWTSSSNLVLNESVSPVNQEAVVGAQEVDGAGEGESELTASPPTTVDEARARAKLLHEAFSGSLQVMHRDFFREDEKLKLPSNSLEDVFAEMARSHNVELRWLAVDANAMSVDHEPQSEFDERAIAALTSGKPDYELATADSFQYVGSIHLATSCLKCHARSRTSNEPRQAGLVIRMPLETDTE